MGFQCFRFTIRFPINHKVRHGDDVVLHWADSDVEILLEGGDAFDRVTLPSSESVRVTGTLTVLRDEEKEIHSLVMTVEALVTVGSQD